MEKRRFGRTDHWSTVAIFGAAAFYDVEPGSAERALDQVLAAGVNHIDVAPSYGKAEELLGPHMHGIRKQFFLGCKTMERTRQGAANELRRSLERLQVDSFDLYQLHAITNQEELDQVTGKGGALEAALEAKEQGLTRFIGITGHGHQVPEVFLKALHRYDFDTILFPVNFVLFANPLYRKQAETLLKTCRDQDVGVMAIKAIARAPWKDQNRTADTWYQPFDDLDHIQPAVNFALSQEVTGLCTAGDVKILPLFLQACENYSSLSVEQQEEQIAQARQYETIFES